ncbi:MAG: DUF4424 family protein [Desulfomonilaceae bacterium]
MQQYRRAFSSIVNTDVKQVKHLNVILGLVIAASALIPATQTFANDTVARVGAGGLSFTKTEDIRMLEEILQISRRQVKVKYRFRNESDQDIHTTVAFPLPSYDVCPSDAPRCQGNYENLQGSSRGSSSINRNLASSYGW